MKKRILSIVLVMVMVLSLFNMTGLTAFAEEGGDVEHTHCICGEATCTTAGHSEKTFTAMTDGFDGSNMTSGSYYLAEDVTLSKDIVIPVGVRVNLCLNGHVLTGTGDSTVITIEGGTLYLCDCNATSTNTISGKAVTGGVITGGNNAEGTGGGVNATFGTTGNTGGSIDWGTGDIGSWKPGGTIGSGSSNHANFYMYGGNIVDNTANEGGGVYVGGGSQFTMHGGSITGNIANTAGGGVYANDMTISGTVNVSGNHKNDTPDKSNNIYLPSGKTIKVASELGGDASLGITTATAPTDENPIKVAVGGTGHKDIDGDLDKFFADNSTEYETQYDGTNKQINLTLAPTPSMTGISASNVTETYDGNEHGITVEGAPTGATIKYGETEGTYDLDESPIIKNVGTKTVYYKVTKEGYKDFTGSATVTINKKNVTVTPNAGQSKIYGNTDPTFEYDTTPMVSGDTLNGNLSRALGENKGEYAFTLGTLANSNYNIALATDAPKFEIKARPVTLSWPTNRALTYNNNEQGITATVTNKVGSDTVDLTYANNMKTAVGSYTAKVTALSNTNYTLVGATAIEQDWSIAYLVTDSVIAVSGNKKIAGGDWYTDTVTLTAPSGYTFSHDKSDWKTTDTISTNGDMLKAYYLKNADGFITGMKSVTLKIDTVAPTAEISIKENKFNSLINDITFGLFFKDTVDVTITGVDATSGIKSIEYQMVANASDYNENGTWTAYSPFSITADNKCIVYAKVIDNAGNVTISNSKGVVVYTDTTVTSDEQTYIRTTKTDVVTGVTIGANTIEKIVLNGSPIDATNYSVNTNGELVFDGDYLNTLAAQDYNFTVFYKPLNETYVNGTDNEAPANTVITLHAEKAVGAVNITNALDKVYDNNVVADPTIIKDSTQTSIVTYKVSGADDSTYTAEKPKNAGTYTLKVLVPADDNYTEATTTQDFTISKADGKVTITDNFSKTFDGSPVIVPIAQEHFGTGATSVEYKVKGTEQYRTSPYYEAGTYIVRVTAQADNNYKEAFATKEFTIAQKDVTVTADNASKTYGDSDPTIFTHKVEGDIQDIPLNNIVVTRTEGEDAGKYDITASDPNNANPNYNITFVNGKFEILRKAITKENTVISLGNVLVENGHEQTQEIASATVDGKQITFQVTDNKATEAGIHELTVTGTGNYEGTFTYKFVILSNDDKEIAQIGDIDVAVKNDGKAPKTELQNTKSEMIEMLLTADELSQVASGIDARVWLEVKDATDSISPESKDAIKNAAKGYMIGQFLDISLFKTVGNQDAATQIHETAKKVKIAVTIPDELLTTDKYTTRTYYIVRNHNGQVEILDTVFDKDSKTITFETDRFSDYAIAYKDVVKKPEPAQDEQNNQGGKDANNGNGGPNTGDTNNLILWVILLCGFGAVLTGSKLYDRKRKTEK